MCNHCFVLKSKKRFTDKKTGVTYAENTWRCEKCGQEISIRADCEIAQGECIYIVDDGSSR